MLGDSQIRGPSTASFVITGIQVGKLRAVRLQPMFLVACKLIMCRFLIIPETHFPLKITFFFPPMGIFLSCSILLLVSCQIIFFSIV